LCRALPGETSSLATVARRLDGVWHPVGAKRLHGLDASFGRQDHTISRPRTSSLGFRRLACAHPRSHAKTLSASFVRAKRVAHGFESALHCLSRPTQSRPPHLKPAFRDDVRPPLVSGETDDIYAKSEFG